MQQVTRRTLSEGVALTCVTTPRFKRSVLRAVLLLPLSAVLAFLAWRRHVRAERCLRAERPLPDGVHVRADLPLSLVLPDCDGVVHYGGGGVTMTSVVAGVPQLSLPCGYDQPVMAERVTAAGLALALVVVELLVAFVPLPVVFGRALPPVLDLLGERALLVVEHGDRREVPVGVVLHRGQTHLDRRPVVLHDQLVAAVHLVADLADDPDLAFQRGHDLDVGQAFERIDEADQLRVEDHAERAVVGQPGHDHVVRGGLAPAGLGGQHHVRRLGLERDSHPLLGLLLADRDLVQAPVGEGGGGELDLLGQPRRVGGLEVAVVLGLVVAHLPLPRQPLVEHALHPLLA